MIPFKEDIVFDDKEILAVRWYGPGASGGRGLGPTFTDTGFTVCSKLGEAFDHNVPCTHEEFLQFRSRLIKLHGE